MPSFTNLKIADGSHGSQSQTYPTVVVSALTCHRSETLEKLLQEFSEMTLPSDTRTILLIVDNDKEGSAESLVRRYQSRIADLRYVIEPRPGIPVARNRALTESLEMQADALCFIDDDEYPDSQWLINLVAHWRETHAGLIGGPVQVAPTDSKASLLQKLINRSLAARQDRKNEASAQWPRRGRRPTIVTNNWLCDLRWARDAGIQFDEDLLVTGGSDTDFYRNALQMGCKTSWCSDAIVYEIMGRQRLTLRYQFWRGASQSITHFHFKHQRITVKLAMLTSLVAGLRLMLGCALLVFPVLGFASVVMSMRSMGWAVGRMQAMFGLRSKLYAGATESVSEDSASAEDRQFESRSVA
jgi:succinoglycan biosynthesis protein ExoM